MAMSNYVRIARRWWWFVAIALILSTAAGYCFSSQRPQLYEAEARLLVGSSISNPNPSLDDIRTATQLLETYAMLPTVRPFLETIINQLTLEETPSELQRSIEISTTPATQLMVIRVQDHNAERARVIANTITDVLLSQVPISTTEGIPPTNRLTVLEPATTGSPVDQDIEVRTLFIGASGVLLSVFVIFLFETLDTRLREPEELEQALGVPVLIAMDKQGGAEKSHGVAVIDTPRSSAARSYHLLNAKLAALNDGQPLPSLMILGVEKGSATETALNCAAVFGQRGRQTVILELDEIPAVSPVSTEQTQPPVTELTEDVYELVPLHRLPNVMHLKVVTPSTDLLPLLTAAGSNNLIKHLEGEGYTVLVTTTWAQSKVASLLTAPHVNGIVVAAIARASSRSVLRSINEDFHSVGAHVVGSIWLPRSRSDVSIASLLQPQTAEGRRLAANRA
ncbi:MAG: hypothetical protein IPO91_02320 [Chloroflexi bacterium]|nr:hypothetical protein [Chloroflexota bacterium]